MQESNPNTSYSNTNLNDFDDRYRKLYVHDIKYNLHSTPLIKTELVTGVEHAELMYVKNIIKTDHTHNVRLKNSDRKALLYLIAIIENQSKYPCVYGDKTLHDFASINIVDIDNNWLFQIDNLYKTNNDILTIVYDAELINSHININNIEINITNQSNYQSYIQSKIQSNISSFFDANFIVSLFNCCSTNL